MNEKFFDLSREKQDRMINGAVEVFAKNGFRHASTDDMVKAVGVSKGLWFHYFGSKLGLYNFVYGYSVKYAILELSSVMDANEKNYFEIMKQVEFTKMKISKNYPYMMKFLEQAGKETDSEVLEQTAEDRKILKEKMSSLMKNSEIPGVEEKSQRDKIKKMLQYTVDGVVADKSSGMEKDPEAVYKEIRIYIDFVRKLVDGGTQTKTDQQVAFVAS